ncbi:MAG: murein L,D-transpeptidase catalytic domain family protein [Bacteroidia bacterium]
MPYTINQQNKIYLSPCECDTKAGPLLTHGNSLLFMRFIKLSAVLATLWLIGLALRSAPEKQTHEPNTLEMDSVALMNIWLYERLESDIPRPAFPVFTRATEAYFNLQASGKLQKPLLCVIDFSLPSNLERLWIYDMQNNQIVYHSLVAHGQKSGELYAESWSNQPGSHQSSPGIYLTGGVYFGKHGLSLYLDGQEPGINHLARERAIVMHAAEYVSFDFISKHGRLGRSFGCPAIPVDRYEEIIHLLANQAALYIHHPNHVESKMEGKEMVCASMAAWCSAQAGFTAFDQHWVEIPATPPH